MLVEPLPFRIGRQPGLELVLPSQLVSKAHAEIYERDGALRVRDLGSRNGTFLNREAVTDAPLREGDILYLADFEFRVAALEGAGVDPEEDLLGATMHRSVLTLPRHFVTGTRELRELLDRGNVTMAFQPIVRLPGGELTAYEALGRGAIRASRRARSSSSGSPSTSGAEAELSRLFRRRAVELVRDLPEPAALFLNTHPAEMKEAELVASLEELRALAPHRRPRPGDPREHPRPARTTSPPCASASPRSTWASPTTTSARASRGCSSWRRPRRTT